MVKNNGRIPVGRRLTVAAGAVCKIPSGVKRTPHVHSPSSSYSMFLNRTEQSWSASLFGTNFLINSGSLLEFDALHDHSHCTTGLFARHRRKTDSPAATCTSRDNCTNSTVKESQKALMIFQSRNKLYNVTLIISHFAMKHERSKMAERDILDRLTIVKSLEKWSVLIGLCSKCEALKVFLIFSRHVSHLYTSLSKIEKHFSNAQSHAILSGTSILLGATVLS